MGGSQGAPNVAQYDYDMADEALDPNLGDHGLVDALDFKRLVDRTAMLEKNITSINQNLTDLTTLVKNLVVHPASVAPGVGEASRPPLAVQVGGDPGISFTTPEVSNSLKNLKPPSYKGEEKDRNKDAVHTFLQKWSDLHALRRTPDEQ